MKKENEENRRKFIKLLHDVLEGKGVLSEITLNDQHYVSLIFKIDPEDYRATARWVFSAEFFDMMRKFKIEVIAVEYGDKVRRGVIQMREGPVKDRLTYARSLHELADSVEMKIKVFCEGALFDTMVIDGMENPEVEAFLALTGIDELKKKLTELGFTSCIVRDSQFTSDLLAPGKPQ